MKKDKKEKKQKQQPAPSTEGENILAVSQVDIENTMKPKRGRGRPAKQKEGEAFNEANKDLQEKDESGNVVQFPQPAPFNPDEPLQAGQMVETTEGAKAVEDLQAGDELVTGDGIPVPLEAVPTPAENEQEIIYDEPETPLVDDVPVIITDDEPETPADGFESEQPSPTPAPAPENAPSEQETDNAAAGLEKAYPVVNTINEFFDDEEVEIEPLSAAEENDRIRLEAQARAGLEGFMVTGAALKEIRARKLFRSTHRSFRAYVFEVFGLKADQAYKTIRAVNARQLTDGTTTEIIDGETGEVLTVEAKPLSIRAGAELDSVRKLLDLTNLTETEASQFVRDIETLALELAIQTATAHRPAKDGKVETTQRDFQVVIDTMREVARTGAVELESGEQVEASPAGIQISREIYERYFRDRQFLIDKLRERDARLGEPQEFSKERYEAERDKTEGGLAPSVPSMSCSNHGKTDIRDFKLIYAGWIFSCGCKFRRVEGDDVPRFVENVLGAKAPPLIPSAIK